MIAAADYLSTKDRHPVYDNPRKWGEPGIWNPPTFDVAKFQKRLDKIVGTSDGKPIVRLVWAWQSREFFHTEFDGLGTPTKGEFRAKYRFMTITLPDGDEVDISVPRWILEQRYEPGQYWQTWQQSRYVQDPALGRTVDKRGDPPPDGWYGYLRTVAEHDPEEACCDRAWRDHRRRCWGYYREPSEKDLWILQKAVNMRDKDPQKVSPHEPLPEWALDDAQRLAYAEEKAVEKEGSRLNHDFWHSWVNSHGWRAFESNHKTLTHGKYKFAWPTKFKTDEKSGLSIPE
jgi:hypothetical protein